MSTDGVVMDEREVSAERRRRTIEYGYRVCGLFQGDVLENGHPRICVMVRGHRTSPHRDVEGEDFVTSEL